MHRIVIHLLTAHMLDASPCSFFVLQVSLPTPRTCRPPGWVPVSSSVLTCPAYRVHFCVRPALLSLLHSPKLGSGLALLNRRPVFG